MAVTINIVHTVQFLQYKGPYKSREAESIVSEAQNLYNNGVRELIIVAQDITDYGKDLENKMSLPALLIKIAEIP